jgi:hypothetical protein
MREKYWLDESAAAELWAYPTFQPDNSVRPNMTLMPMDMFGKSQAWGHPPWMNTAVHIGGISELTDLLTWGQAAHSQIP